MNVNQQLKAISDIRAAISKPHIKYVSFDVFDTLLVRPVWKPVDLFYLMEERIREDATLPRIPFAHLRVWAERQARNRMREIAPHYEDVTLDEIYDVIQTRCGLSEEETKRIKKIELAVELQYLSARKTMKAIYNHALSCGKRVIIASDMYLPASFLVEALQRNGYDQIERYFVSSEIRLSKGHGSLYPRMLQELGIRPQEMVHIGDNPRADVERAAKHGINAYLLPKTSELMVNGRVNFAPWHNRLDHAETGYRLVQGMIQNEIFDTIPREGYHKDSLFNGNPYFIGFYGLGPFVLALTQWLLRESSARGNDVLAFVARDGYLPKLAYDMLRPYYKDAPESLYLRISRSVCYPYDVKNTAELMFSNTKMHFERSLTCRQVVASRIFETIDADLERYLQENGVDLNGTCSDFPALMQLLGAYKGGDFSGLSKHRELGQIYYNRILGSYDNIALFDCGYSGRAQRVIAQIVDRKPFGFYIASFDTIDGLDREGLSYANFLSQPFNRILDKEPFVTAMLELLISEHKVGSIVGFTTRNGKIEPVLEDGDVDASTDRVISAVQNGCLDFIRCAVATFGGDIRHLHVTAHTSSRLIRQFMVKPEGKDAAPFANITFSNGMTGEMRKLIDADERRSKWPEGWRAMHHKAAVSHAVQMSDGKIVYKGNQIPARIHAMKHMPSADFVQGVALMAASKPRPEIMKRCVDMVQTKSKWLSAAVLLRKSGGLWKSRASFGDKLVAQGYLLLRAVRLQ